MDVHAVTSNKGSVQLVERDVPVGDGELIRVTSSGICGSDLHMVAMGIEGVVLGHEFGGYTTDNRLVAVRPTGACGTCPSCQRHHSHTCSQAGSSLIGLARDGGLAPYAMVESAQIYEVPGNVSPDDVALVEPLAVVIHGINRTVYEKDMNALVVGAGSIGLLTAAVLADRGLDVTIVARHKHQHEAAEKLGVRSTTLPTGDFDISFDAVCTQQTFDTCVNSTRPGGQLLEFGMFWEPVTLNNAVMMKEISILPSIFYGHNEQHDDFAEAIDFLSRRSTLRNTVVTHTFSLEEAATAFHVAQDKTTGAIKVHFRFDV